MRTIEEAFKEEVIEKQLNRDIIEDGVLDDAYEDGDTDEQLWIAYKAINPNITDKYRPIFNKVLNRYSCPLAEINEATVSETYSKEELNAMVGKVYNLQKINNIYRRKKYDDSRLFAHTTCINCGRSKRVFLSNLVNDPEKYGSCICSDTNIDAKIDNATKLYNGTKKLSSNTSGYTGVSYVRNYQGKPYKKWRAYIEVDGKRMYLGDFDDKRDAIKARKEAGEKGIKWYRDNRNKLTRDMRRKNKKYKTSKYRDTARKTVNVKKDDKK